MSVEELLQSIDARLKRIEAAVVMETTGVSAVQHAELKLLAANPELLRAASRRETERRRKKKC